MSNSVKHSEHSSSKEKVVVAMSGGVDSSVVAGLLMREGYSVVGVTLLFRPYEDAVTENWCCGAGGKDDACGVAKVLEFPHYGVDCAEEFENKVLLPSWREYNRGRTPSPCILCNEKIKFDLLLRWAEDKGIRKIATGHYARISGGARPVLTRGRDSQKDQSYFLFSLSKEHLGSVLFPLGDYEKGDVRELAREMGLGNAERKESQDACFVYEDGGFAEGLRVKFGGDKKKGLIVDTDGNRLGEHDGVHRYTIGQRKGLGIALGRRAYVTKIDGQSREVVLTDDASHLESTELEAEKVNWTGGDIPSFPLECEAQIRYRHRPVKAVAEMIEDDRLVVRFEKPQRAVAPGQAVVLYRGDRVLGGGWIS